MLSQSMNLSNENLHENLFEEVEALFLRLAVIKGGNVSIENNIPELAKILFKNGQVKIWIDLVPIAKVLIQIRDDGYDIGSVIKVIWTAYNSAIETKRPKFTKKSTDFWDEISKLFENNFMDNFMKKWFNNRR